METNAYYRNWDDLVFENRNKEYGAYTLRRSYDDKVLFAMFVSVSLAALLFLIPVEKKVILPVPLPEKDVIVWEREVFIEPRARPKASSQTPARKETQRHDTPPIVTREPVQPLPVEAQPDVDFIEQLDGEAIGGDIISVGSDATSEVVSTQPAFVMNPEVMPAYAGGHAGIMKYLQKKLKYPPSARRANAEGTVYVSFIVRGDGTVYDVEVIKGFHPDCDKEAVRVVSAMPGWTGGAHGGMPVSVKMVLPIKFSIKHT